jgi:hypothetical protein
VALSDDEYIALAVLHGAEFWKDHYNEWWYLTNNSNTAAISDQQFAETGHYYFDSRTALARTYCLHHNLAE